MFGVVCQIYVMVQYLCITWSKIVCICPAQLIPSCPACGLRMQVARLVINDGWSTREAGRYTGYNDRCRKNQECWQKLTRSGMDVLKIACMSTLCSMSAQGGRTLGYPQKLIQ